MHDDIANEEDGDCQLVLVCSQASIFLEALQSAVKRVNMPIASRCRLRKTCLAAGMAFLSMSEVTAVQKLFPVSTCTGKLTVEDVDEGEDEPAHVNLSLEFLFELSFGRR